MTRNKQVGGRDPHLQLFLLHSDDGLLLHLLLLRPERARGHSSPVRALVVVLPRAVGLPAREALSLAKRPQDAELHERMVSCLPLLLRSPLDPVASRTSQAAQRSGELEEGEDEEEADELSSLNANREPVKREPPGTGAVLCAST